MMQYRNRRQRKKRIMEILISFALVAAVFAVCITVRSLSGPAPDVQSSPSSDAGSSGSPNCSAVPEPSEPDSAGSEPLPESSSAPDPAAPADGDIPESSSVDGSYFDDAVFIGDSRTEGFTMYNNIAKGNSLTYKGLKVDTAFTEPCINVNGSKLTVMDALAQKTFTKVYIMLGINELGWIYSDVFISDYGKIIDRIREINPQAVVYVQSILPVTAKKSESDQIYNNFRISAYNTLLRQMAQEKQVRFVDTAQAVALDDGTLPEELAFDGVHLNREGCERWMAYLKSHTA